MQHRPYSRRGSGKDAVLFVHGIAGSPAHFRDLIPVVPAEYSVYNILLDGHGGTVREFSRSSMDKWKEQVHATLQKLFATHERVVIVAHSMGTLFAIQAAIQYPGRIPALFLLSIPTRPWVRFSTLVTAVKVAFGRIDSPKTTAMRGETAMQITPKLWEYIGWIPRMMGLLAECRQTRKALPQLNVPTQVFQSKVDELVSFRSCKDWQNHPHIQTIVLSHSGHFVYGAEDIPLLQSRLVSLLTNLTNPNYGL